MLRNDGGAPVTGLANVSLPALQFSATAAVNLPAGGQQQLVVNITQEAQLARRGQEARQLKHPCQLDLSLLPSPPLAAEGCRWCSDRCNRRKS